MEGTERQQAQNMSLPIEWYIPENIHSKYATNVVAQAGQNEFIISFFEAHPPLLVGQPEENLAKLEQLGSIRAECVGRIIIAIEQMPSVIAALQATFDAYQAAKAKE